jgi:sugar phosphate isomerase/epimerase
MKKLPNVKPEQLPSVNMKEVEKGMTSVGEGIIDWKRIFAAGSSGGIQHYFVENDAPKEAFSDIAASYKYLSQLTF